MEYKILEKLGLTETESKIYMILLRLGSTHVTPVIKKAELHRATVYDVLDRLIEKGLVSYIIKEGKRFVTDPRYVVANAYINQGKELIMKLFGLSDHGKMTTALVDDLESRLAPTQRQSLSINYA